MSVRVWTKDQLWETSKTRPYLCVKIVVARAWCLNLVWSVFIEYIKYMVNCLPSAKAKQRHGFVYSNAISQRILQGTYWYTASPGQDRMLSEVLQGLNRPSTRSQGEHAPEAVFRQMVLNAMAQTYRDHLCKVILDFAIVFFFLSPKIFVALCQRTGMGGVSSSLELFRVPRL